MKQIHIDRMVEVLKDISEHGREKSMTDVVIEARKVLLEIEEEGRQKEEFKKSLRRMNYNLTNLVGEYVRIIGTGNVSLGILHSVKQRVDSFSSFINDMAKVSDIDDINPNNQDWRNPEIRDLLHEIGIMVAAGDQIQEISAIIYSVIDLFKKIGIDLYNY